MVDCNEVAAQSDAFIDGELSASGREWISLHIRECQDCADAIENKVKLKHMVRTSARSLSAPADLRIALRAHLTLEPRGAQQWGN